jgi:hypothetical protein
VSRKKTPWTRPRTKTRLRTCIALAETLLARVVP